MIQVHTDVTKATDKPFAVLVFPIFDGHVLWVKHPRRGWEVPGGKVEPGESPEQAVHRETFEEAGATLENVRWVGEFLASDGNLKSIYFADVVDVQTRPEMSEMQDVMAPRPMWSPSECKGREDVSFIMKDEVYETVWPLLLTAVQRQGV